MINNIGFTNEYSWVYCACILNETTMPLLWTTFPNAYTHLLRIRLDGLF